jgi:hypothetical protein
MDSFWLKVVIVIAVIIGLVYAGNWALESLVKQTVPEKTIGQQWRQDDERLRAEPNIAPSPNAAPVQAATPQPQKVGEAPKFKELTEDELAGAEQLFELAITQRKMARLPGVGYGPMVQYCRQISERYPRSKFDYQARRMLGEVPRDQWERYQITQEEIDGPK